MTPRASLLAAVTAAALVVAAPARADEPAPAAGVDADVATAHVARSTRLPATRPRLSARHAQRLLRRTMRADGYQWVTLDCGRAQRVRRAECRVASARRAGTVWSGRGSVAVVAGATRVTYVLDSQPA